jgi:hypothetical protein
MSVEIPKIEDKIYSLFGELFMNTLVDEEIPRKELIEIVDEALKTNNMTMDSFIQYLLIGVEAGYTVEEQFEVFKKLFIKK